MSNPPCTVVPFTKPFIGKISVPGSKSITNRIFPLAVLSGYFSQEKIFFSGVLESEDSEIMRNALSTMGAKISQIQTADTFNTAWEIEAGDFFSDTNEYEIFCGNSGTSLRFLTALCTLRKGKTILTGVERMKQRPIGDLVSGIEQLGATVKYLENDGFPPLVISPIPEWEKISTVQKISLKGDMSSQFFTALFHIAPMFPKGLEIAVEGDLVSKPYIDMTFSILSDFGIEVKNQEKKYHKFFIPPQKFSAPHHFLVEGDASGASYPLAIALITGGKCEIKNLPEKISDSIQGDAKFSQLVLEKMKGKKVGVLKHLGEINLEDIPDVAMTAVVLCAYSDGYSKISGLSTLRHKECDRIFALESNLKKMGVRVEAGEDFIEIWGDPKNIHGAEIECFGDHRVAMCFAVLGTVVKGVKILDPDCVQKTYPTFWKDLENWRR